jgi:hypothetical protein
MQVKTWLQRLTDESNLWFNAVKSEDENNLNNAASFYIKDALECIKQHSLVRAALSCSCAANCLTRMGATLQARKLYSAAAAIYMENSDIAMSESIREALWSLQEAFENYILAGEGNSAGTVRERYVKLAARTNPFSKAEHAAKELESRKAAAESVIAKSAKKEASIPDELAREIENLLQTRKPLAKPDRFDPSYVMKSINVNGGSRLDEKSIAS